MWHHSYFSNFRAAGIGGEKCDECAPGFVQASPLTPQHPVLTRKIPHGDKPQCVACGECFSNWERILAELAGQTARQVEKAETVKVTGVAGAYTRSFEDMEGKLEQVRKILRSASISQDELAGVQAEINRISNALRDTTQNLDDLEGDLADIRQSLLQGSSGLEYLRADSDGLKLDAEDMKEKITTLQEANVEGALNLTREAKRRSEEAATKVRSVQADKGELDMSEQQRKATEQLMSNAREHFSSTQSQNRRTLQEIVSQILSLESKIPELNRQICDGTTSADDPCDELCGGAGCGGKCGGLSCLNGALSKAEEALGSARMADEKLVDVDRRAEQVLIDMTQAHQRTAEAGAAAQEAFDRASEARNRSLGEVSETYLTVQEAS